MKITVQPSKGVQPRLAPHLLPADGAQVAMNAKLLSGDLEAWNDVDFTSELFKSGTVNTIHLMARDSWLHWVNSELMAGVSEVDVVRGPIAGDTTERTYFAGVAGGPRVTNIAMAIGSCGGQYPCDSLLLGIPAPTDAPILAVDAGSAEESNITLANPGAETGGIAGWSSTVGDLQVHDADDVPGLAPQAGSYYFYGGAVAVTEFYQDVDAVTAGIVPLQGLKLKWWQASGADGSKAAMGLRFYDSGNVLLGSAEATVQAVAPSLEWQSREISGQVPENTSYVRLYMRMERVGVGDNDAFIDSITLDAQDFTLNFPGENLSGWTVSPNGGGSGAYRAVEIDAALGFPAPAFKFTSDELVGYMYRNIGSDASPATTFTYNVYLKNDADGRHHYFMPFAGSEGIGTALYIDKTQIALATVANWDGKATVLGEVLFTGATVDRILTVSFAATPSGTTGAKVDITITDAQTSEVLVDEEDVDFPIDGGYLAFKGWANRDNPNYACWVDNVVVTVVAPDPTSTQTYVNYVVVYYNEFDEVGAPGPKSRTVQRSANAPITVTTQTDAPAGYGITHKGIFRAATGATSSAYLFVAKIPLAQADYEDTLADEDLGDPLESALYDLPPVDLQGLLAMPNRFLAGFTKNELVFSVTARYYAWPVDWRLATDYPIVGIGAIDATVIVLTEEFPYIATGYSPDAMSMRKLEVPWACSSKRSVAYLKEFGVVYASPDGLVAINGQGAPILLTGSLLTREQWQDLNPESIYGIAHDDRYFGFYDKGDGDKGGFILDVKQGGFGLVFIDIWAQAAFSDALTDRLHLVMENDVWAWNESTYKLPYVWRSRLFKMPRPTAFAAAQVRAADYDDLWMRLYADGVVILDKQITSELEFVLPDKLARYTTEVDFRGTSRVQWAEFAEEMEELS